MTVAYIVKDDRGNYGQSIPITQGESRLVSVYLFNADGTPYIYTGTLAEIYLKIFSAISTASIHKQLSLGQVTPITMAGVVSNMIGFQFQLSAVNTAAMAANNVGLPMIATITDTAGTPNVLEIDFSGMFNITVPVVTT